MGSFDIVQTLLNEGADVNGEAAFSGEATALQLAAIGGYVSVAELLLESGADSNAAAAKIEERTALEGSVEDGRIDILKLLWTAGAGMDQKQFERASNFAEESGHLATKNYLGTLYPEFLSQQHPIPSQLEGEAVLSNISSEDEFT